ncbi:hypothetical protein KDH_12150 [Dictyobacter sp. S3.2.2.5]|uniref:Uncharacterized protein n=1 Tax=Dictyobacter halimunensis TaxID=3026934 RepID=A0ABQ6FPL0_9CHLR|nr:hypothetical protein KDH_12150 [Dictyobacter sp. S3.2.2.5]
MGTYEAVKAHTDTETMPNIMLALRTDTYTKETERKLASPNKHSKYNYAYIYTYLSYANML